MKKIVRHALIATLAGASMMGASLAPASAFAVVEVSDPAPYIHTIPTVSDTGFVFAQGNNRTTNLDAVSSHAVVTPENIANNPDLTEVQKTVLTHAYDGLGGTYVWGGKTYKNWDCSGFVSYVFKQANIDLTAYTYAMVNELERTDTPEPGDIVFQNGYSHVGIYIGDGKMISALNPSQGTLITDVDGDGYMSVDGYYKVPADVLTQAEASLADGAVSQDWATDITFGEVATYNQ